MSCDWAVAGRSQARGGPDAAPSSLKALVASSRVAQLAVACASAVLLALVVCLSLWLSGSLGGQASEAPQSQQGTDRDEEPDEGKQTVQCYAVLRDP